MRGRTLLGLTLLVAAVAVPPAQAAFPGDNGKITFVRSPGSPAFLDIWTVNPTGSAETNLTNTPSDHEFDPVWSADGTRIAYSQLGGIWIMDADGGNRTQITNSSRHRTPAWSPDGTKIAFKHDDLGLMVMDADGSDQQVLTSTSAFNPNWSPDGTRIAFNRDDIRVIDADGGNETSLTPGLPGEREPTWSPDGTRIAFTSEEGSSDRELHVIDTDGTGEIPLTDSPGVNHSPAWSPDGTTIAFTSTRTGAAQIFTMNSDGTNQAQIPGGSSAYPDWQPVPAGYARPRGATPVRASLVPAYIACLSPNRTHGPPLAFDSCSPPTERSGVLTMGTPDANGAPASMSGSLRLETVPGNPATAADEADVTVQVSITDVRCQAASAACPGGPLSDYAGRLLATANALRITDRLNTPPGPEGGPGTGDAGLQVPLDCAATADPAIGSTCTVATTLDAVLPGIIAEGKRAIWELGQLQVRDAGPNGTGFESPACPPDCGDGDETLFLRQGVFVP